MKKQIFFEEKKKKSMTSGDPLIKISRVRGIERAEDALMFYVGW